MKRVDTKRRLIDSKLESRKMRRKDIDDFKVVEGVIDPPTLKILYRLLNKGVISRLFGAISTGKEANVYRGEDQDGYPLAVKIYRMTTAETDFMLEYIQGDPRFRRVKRRSRALIPLWARKEYLNLKRYYDVGVRVPKPLAIERNVLVMEFIGNIESKLPAPLIRQVKIPSPVETFNQIIEMIELGYTKAELVHADLSEFNILWLDEPIFIDVSQAVLKSHEKAKRYLFRDIKNVANYFRRLGVETEDPKIITEHILSVGESE